MLGHSPVLILTALTAEPRLGDLPSPLLCPRSLGCLVLRSISICVLVETRPYSVAQYIAQDSLVSLVQKPQATMTSFFSLC